MTDQNMLGKNYARKIVLELTTENASLENKHIQTVPAC